MTEDEETDLRARACHVLGHRQDTPCVATIEQLLEQTVGLLEAIDDDNPALLPGH